MSRIEAFFFTLYISVIFGATTYSKMHLCRTKITLFITISGTFGQDINKSNKININYELTHKQQL